jgi:hypothetical protein
MKIGFVSMPFVGHLNQELQSSERCSPLLARRRGVLLCF